MNGLIWIGSSLAQAQTIRYVSPSGTNNDPTTATSWATSTTNLQGAVDASGSGGQVWVAAGIYRPGGNSYRGRNQSFSMKNGVAIYGGFAGSEGNLTDRPNVNPVTGQPSSSTLSGDFGGNYVESVMVNSNLSNTAELDGFVITGGDYESTTLGGGGMYNMNSSPRLRNLLLVNNFALNGGGMFNNQSSPTLTNCSFLANLTQGADPNNPTGGGAGMYNTNSSPQLTDCIFKANEALDANGGGIFNTNSNPVLTRCTFQNNSAPGRGGGLVNYNSSPRLMNCSFLNNAGGIGGGIANESGNPTVTDCMFDGNQTDYYGGGMYTTGGTPIVTNCTFQNNQAIQKDPVYGLGGGGLFISNFNDPKIQVGLVRVTNCAFLKNSAIFGGGVANTYQATLTNCTFQSNSAISGVPPSRAGTEISGEGGGLFSQGTGLTLISCSFQTNKAATSGGGLFGLYFSGMLTNCSFQSNSAPTGGGLYYAGGRGFPNSGTSPSLTNCSFQSNSATTGSGIYNINKSTPTLSNCILFGNGGQNTIVNGLNEESNAADSKVTASYSLFESSETDYTGSNNLTATVSPFASTSSTQLKDCSVSIDAGDPASTTATSGTTDLAGNPRFYNGGRIDLGAYESQSTRTVGITQQPASGTSINVGSSVSVAVSTTGTVSSYQWYKNGQILTGVASASMATLSLPNVQPSASGSYSLLVTGSCNSVTSTAFSLSVVYFIRFVRQGGTGDGSSWATASGDWQSQVNANGVQQVWVAQGIYKPTTTTNRNISFTLKNGVAVYGGFAGTETQLDQRPLTWPSSSTLSGDIGTAGDPTDNTQAVVASNGLDNSAELDGFVITQGYSTTNAGGGLYNGNSSPLLRNLLITGNAAVNGGGMANLTNSNPRLLNCEISNNSASSQGGGLFNQLSTPSLVNCLLSGNSASLGGGIFHRGSASSFQLINCTLRGNTATSAGAAINQTGPTVLTNCVLWMNGSDESNVLAGDTPVSATYCLFQPGVRSYSSSPTNLTTTTSPFASSTSSQLRSGSPAINTGNNAAYSASSGSSVDLAGGLRLQNGVIDLGALESAFGPDLAATLLIDNLNFSPNSVGTMRDFIVSLTEVNYVVASGSIAFKVAKLTGFTISYSTSNGTSAVSGGIATTNGSWSFTEDASYITVQTSSSLPAFSNQIIGFSLTRKAGIPSNTIQSINVTILPNAGNEQNFANNGAVTSVVAN